MTPFDPREAHSLVCLQSNRGIPDHAQECVCCAPLHPDGHHAAVMGQAIRRDFQPTFEVAGPFTARKWWPRKRHFVFAVAIVAAALLTGAVLRHIVGVISP